MNHQYSFEEKYQAMLNKDSAFEGVFITAVKTTGIFCRPVCTARKPKPENVEFFDTTREALLHGYRPCRVCNPLHHIQAIPIEIDKLLNELNANPYLRLKDADLEARGIHPVQLRRWFQKNHHMSFHAYQRMLRINTAFQKITEGESVTAAAFDSGYQSLSGFNDRYRALFKANPSQRDAKTVINTARIATPLGPMLACATDQGLCLLEFTDRRMLERELKDLCKKLNAVLLPGNNPHLTQTQQELEEYFEGRRTTFAIKLHTPGSSFQCLVWHALQHVPYGETRSYKQQATMLKKPTAVRAVAVANGMNRISIIIPCHRVIGENGKLTGYGGGLPRKQWLLSFERTTVNSLAASTTPQLF